MKDSRAKGGRDYIVEGAVIVLSILLAFGIDALWAQHQERLEEREILASLKSDFVANLDSVTRVIEAHQAFRDRVKTLIELSPEEIRTLSQTRISELMLATANPWTFDAVRGTTDTLVNGGKLGVLSDPDLRDSLLTFLNRVADSGEDIAYLIQGAQDVWAAEIKHGGPWSDPATEIGYVGEIRGLGFIPKATAEDLLSVRADPILMGHSKRFHINAAYYIEELELIRNQIEEILALIAASD
jgi:hypothetical protein